MRECARGIELLRPYDPLHGASSSDRLLRAAEAPLAGRYERKRVGWIAHKLTEVCGRHDIGVVDRAEMLAGSQRRERRKTHGLEAIVRSGRERHEFCLRKLDRIDRDGLTEAIGLLLLEQPGGVDLVRLIVGQLFEDLTQVVSRQVSQRGDGVDDRRVGQRAR